MIMVYIDLSAIAAGEVSMDPENLRFQYDMMEEAEPAPPKSSKRGKPQVYREQVNKCQRLAEHVRWRASLTVRIISHFCVL